MSILPPGIRMYFDPELSMPLGPAIPKVTPVAMDPVIAFEVKNHFRVGGEFIREKDCRQIKGAAQEPGAPAVQSVAPPTPVAAPPSTEKPPKFKVGDVIRRTDFECNTFKRVVTGYAEDGRVLYVRIDATGHRYKDRCGAEFLELVSPSEPKEADGWTPAIAMLCPDAKAGEWEAKRFDGSIVSADRIRMSLREWAERLAAKGLEGHFRLVKQQ